MLLTENDIESELSYAYLHAVASRAGCECRPTGRLSDNAGVDAVVRVKERFASDSLMCFFSVDVQLKATRKPPTMNKGRYSVWLKDKNYNELRSSESPISPLLIVLFLPADSAQWLACSDDALIAKRAAYWQCLYEAPGGSPTGQTVYIPTTNLFTPDSLRILLTRFSRGERLTYAEHE